MKRRIATVVFLFLAMSGLGSQAIAAAGEPGNDSDMTHNSHGSDMTDDSTIFMTYD